MSVNAEVAEVMKRVRQRTVLHVEVKDDLDGAARVLQQQPSVDVIERRDQRIIVTLRPGIEDYSDLPTSLIQAGHRLTLFREEEVNLESAFMALTRGMGEKI